jgi:hypothetical protein
VHAGGSAAQQNRTASSRRSALGYSRELTAVGLPGFVSRGNGKGEMGHADMLALFTASRGVL